ncbi:hypothetical protein T02_476 [Trichinella nativa]|uniref:Uncharacterized protein n=1 Tax=Trichinella nativa TaxID=6335 RepID=A0A0V1LDL4_9BILA|nr:hypothetical protein T02_476 [Trichinella nativa]
MQVNLKVLIIIAKSPIKKLQSKRPIREKQMLYPWLISLEPRSKSTSEPNCIQFDTVRGWKHCAFDWKIN